MNLKRIHFLLLLSCFYFIAGLNCRKADLNPTPANPNATIEARALLNFLYSIHGKYILSGHHNPIHNPTQYTNAVKKMTGDYPVVWGSDFSFNFGRKDPDSVRQAMIDTAIAMHKKGHIITLMWHSCFPTECDSCSSKTIWLWQPGVSKETWDSLTTPGTRLNQQWQVQVDHVAKYLKELQDAHVPVLWRPYHEMNGVWFWWCNKKGKDGFVKLWRMMYNRFVNVHHLNNLIWVWNTNAPRSTPGDEAYAYKDFFPGLDVVDVLAADVYHNDYKQSHHDDLLKIAQGKLIALGEVGQMPTPEIFQQQPQWVWFMEWTNFLFKANKPEAVKALYSSSRVLKLKNIRTGKNGLIKVRQNL